MKYRYLKLIAKEELKLKGFLFQIEVVILKRVCFLLETLACIHHLFCFRIIIFLFEWIPSGVWLLPYFVLLFISFTPLKMEGVSPTYVSFINHDQLSLTSFDNSNDSGKGGSVDNNCQNTAKEESSCPGKSGGKPKIGGKRRTGIQKYINDFLDITRRDL